MNRTDGFSLVEVLMALFILSTTAVGFMRVTQTSIKATQDVEIRYYAGIVADNQMIALFSEGIQLQIGEETGSEPQHQWEFDWTRTVTEGPIAGTLQIDLQVRRADDPLVLAAISTLKRVQEL